MTPDHIEGGQGRSADDTRSSGIAIAIIVLFCCFCWAAVAAVAWSLL